MSINFEVKTPFKYAGGSGGQIECSFIELRAPTGKQSHMVCDIESRIQSGLVKMAEMLSDEQKKEAADQAKAKQEAVTLAKAKAKEEGVPYTEEKEEVDPDQFLAQMMMSGIDMSKMVLLFKQLFQEVAYMGGEKSITVPRLEEMDHKDLKEMIGVYGANFILT